MLLGFSLWVIPWRCLQGHVLGTRRAYVMRNVLYSESFRADTGGGTSGVIPLGSDARTSYGPSTVSDGFPTISQGRSTALPTRTLCAAALRCRQGSTPFKAWGVGGNQESIPGAWVVAVDYDSGATRTSSG
eukprot:3337838-Pyramimonas_sp.AAC.1